MRKELYTVRYRFDGIPADKQPGQLVFALTREDAIAEVKDRVSARAGIPAKAIRIQSANVFSEKRIPMYIPVAQGLL